MPTERTAASAPDNNGMTRARRGSEGVDRVRAVAPLSLRQDRCRTVGKAALSAVLKNVVSRSAFTTARWTRSGSHQRSRKWEHITR